MLALAEQPLHVQAKYTAKAEDKISEARGKPAQGATNDEASVSRYNAMKAAAAAALNRYSSACLCAGFCRPVPRKAQAVLLEGCNPSSDQPCKVLRPCLCAEYRMSSRTHRRPFRTRQRKPWIRAQRYSFAAPPSFCQYKVCTDACTGAA